MARRHPARIVAARHGSTAWNAVKGEESKQKIRGWIDIPLNEDGRKEATQLARNVKGLPIDEIYSSNLCRAMETAEAVGDVLGLPVLGTTRLRPWNVGVLNGRPVLEAMPIMDIFVKNEDSVLPNGESFKHFRERLLGEVLRLYRRAEAQGAVIFICAHTRCLQAIKAFIVAGAPEDLTVDDKAMDDYSDEILPAGYIQIGEGFKLIGEHDDGPISQDEDKDEA